MRSLDLYLVSAVVKIYVAAQAAFFSVFICIDLVDKFFKVQPPVGTSKALFLLQIYASQLPALFDTTAPFIFVLVCVIVLAGFHHKSQLVAINAAGISLQRCLASLMVLAIGLGFLIFSSGEWLKPNLTSFRLSISDPTLRLLGQEHISFRDNLALIDSEAIETMGFSESDAVIDIQELDTDKKEGRGFHVTFLDDRDCPVAKLFAKSFVWVKGGAITLQSAKFLPYGNGAALKVFNSASLGLNIPLEKVVLASKNMEALSYSELGYFKANLRFRTEQIFRWFVPFFPLLMLLVSFGLALPLIFKKPVYAYFASLASSFSVFFVAGFFRSAMDNNDLPAEFCIPVVLLSCPFVYLMRLKSLPT